MTTTDTGPQPDLTAIAGEPQTEAGRRLLEGRAPALDDTSPEAGDRWADYNDLERAILAIEAEARWLTVERLAALAVRFANHGKTPPPNDPCGSCALAADEVIAALAQEETRA